MLIPSLASVACDGTGSDPFAGAQAEPGAGGSYNAADSSAGVDGLGGQSGALVDGSGGAVADDPPAAMDASLAADAAISSVWGPPSARVDFMVASHHTPTPTGWGPIQVADFDEDGRDDVALLNFLPNTLRVAFNQGDGSFLDGPAQAFTSLWATTIGDVNDDGHVDLLARYGGEKIGFFISLFLGDGEGNLSATSDIEFETINPGRMALGDLDGDQLPELVTLDGDTQSVVVVANLGAGQFATPSSVSVGANPWEVTLAHLNEDQALDVAVTSFNDGVVSVLLNDGEGQLSEATSYPTSYGASAVVAGDLDLDGAVDLVVANDADDTVSVLLNLGAGQFGSATGFFAGRHPKDLALADVDDDGNLDVAVANEAIYTSILRGDGEGGFLSAEAYGANGTPHSIAVSDMSGDGKPDLVVGTGISGFSVLANRGDGTFAAGTHTGVGGEIAIGDMNGDGMSDVTLLGGEVQTLVNQGGGTFAPSPVAPTSALYDLKSSDLNGDQIPDLVGVDRLDNVGVLLGNSDGSFAAAVEYPAGKGPYFVAVGDLNGDDAPDLVTAAFGLPSAPPSLILRFNLGDGTFDDAVQLPFEEVPFAMTIADLDDDGNNDLAVAGQQSLTTFLGDGAGSFPQTEISMSAAGLERLEASDLDNDGLQDLVATSDDGLSVLINQGGGSLTTVLVDGLGELYDAVFDLAVADVNHDLWPDLVVAEEFTGAVVFLNAGNHSFTRSFSYGAVQYVDIADLNADAWADLVVTGADSCTVLFNAGP